MPQPPSPASVTIYLTRHGQTWLNLLERVQGFCDSPLTPDGRAMATRLGRGLAAEVGAFQAAYCADMVRHRETTELALQAMASDVPLVQVAALREASFGGFEGAPNSLMWDATLCALGHDSLEDVMQSGTTIPDFLDAIRATNPTSILAVASANNTRYLSGSA